jgi:hypothetical protein
MPPAILFDILLYIHNDQIDIETDTTICLLFLRTPKQYFATSRLKTTALR